MVVTFSVGNSIEANAAYACSSGESRCADAKLTYGGSKTAFSASVYFKKGEIIAFQWDNDSPGREYVNFFVVSGNERISEILYAPSLGNNYGTVEAPATGFYQLYGACQSGLLNICQGGGRISLE